MVLSWSLYISFSLAFLWLFYLGHDHRHRSQEAFEYEKKLWKAKKQITLQLMELESQTHQLQKLVKIDALTGLYNRRTFDSELKKELLRASRAQSSLSLLIVDIDHFKQVNDQLGHKKGDEYLSKVAQTLKTICLRQTDMVSRYGGEEFALLLPGTDKKGLEVLAQNLNDAILDLQLPHPNGKAVTISIGGAEYQPRHMAGDDLFNLADQALYKVKASGRNHYLIQ
jgi:diguanylate cyclase (GGDEF)-like protein